VLYVFLLGIHSFYNTHTRTPTLRTHGQLIAIRCIGVYDRPVHPYFNKALNNGRTRTEKSHVTWLDDLVDDQSNGPLYRLPIQYWILETLVKQKICTEKIIQNSTEGTTFWRWTNKTPASHSATL